MYSGSVDMGSTHVYTPIAKLIWLCGGTKFRTKKKMDFVSKKMICICKIIHLYKCIYIYIYIKVYNIYIYISEPDLSLVLGWFPTLFGNPTYLTWPGKNKHKLKDTSSTNGFFSILYICMYIYIYYMINHDCICIYEYIHS